MRHQDYKLRLIIDISLPAEKIIGADNIDPFCGDLKALMMHKGFNYCNVSKKWEGLQLSLQKFKHIDNYFD